MFVFNINTACYCFSCVYVYTALLCVIMTWQQVCATYSKDVITLGYITGAHSSDQNRFYSPPGQFISGAITMAVNDVNNDVTVLPDHQLNFVVMETFGTEEESLRQVVTHAHDANISALIGPQETCIHEGRVAAAFNRPMISYVSSLLQPIILYVSSHVTSTHDLIITILSHKSTHLVLFFTDNLVHQHATLQNNVFGLSHQQTH